MFITGLIKFFIGFAGLLLTFIFLGRALIKRRKRNSLKYAAINFFSTAIIILVITVVEFLLYPTNPKTDKLLLTAYREAPLGGIWLALYTDQTWELGYSSREITATGTFALSGDTLSIKSKDGSRIIGEIEETMFLIHQNNLVELKNSGIKSLEIKINNLEKPN